MKFQLSINLQRLDDSIEMPVLTAHLVDMVQMAERAGFSTVWAAEHHALEMTIAPNPFQILTWLAGETDRIRLGTAVATAPYWHPIKLAGEAAFTDLISGGRLEFGIGSGAYQREFDRMRPGLAQTDGWRYMQEILPAVLALWQGDYAHDGEYWSFPASTSVPKPVQKPHPPLWVAARAPVSFEYAIDNRCNLMTWPLNRPFAEAELYRQRMLDALAKHQGGDDWQPVFAMMRHSAVYSSEKDWQKPVQAVQRQLGQFENLFRNLGDVQNGFPRQIPLQELTSREEYNADMLSENLLFGTPEQVIRKLQRYQALGVDEFIYSASMGYSPEDQRESLALFCNEVMPAFS